MIAAIGNTLAGNPILTLFVVIGLGYLLGELNVLGFRFGVAGVLFVGIAAGALNHNIRVPEIVASLGLILFVYTIGIQSGPAFFASFRKQGWRDTVLAVAVLIVGVLLTLGSAVLFKIPHSRVAGLYTGALTNTPALAAVRDRIHDREKQANGAPEQIQTAQNEAVVGYAVAYPVGVIGVLLCFSFTRRIWRVKFTPEGENAAEIRVRDFVVENPGVIGRQLAEVLRHHEKPGFVISRIRQQGKTDVPRDRTQLARGDVVAVVGDEQGLERAEQIFGEPADVSIEMDRSHLDYRRFLVSNRQVVGKRIRELDLTNQAGATITRIRRADVELVPTPETRLELGDIVRVVTERETFPAMSKFFGDSIRGNAETQFVSVAIGTVLGVLAGMVPIPLPGGESVHLGLAGGPLLVALILGKLERSGRISWIMPLAANLTIRQIGLLFFLAGVGINAGFAFVQALRTNGWQLLLAGAVATLGVTLLTLVVGYRILRIPFDSLMGLMSGIQTQPACLAYADEMAHSETPNLAYASVYPIAMIAKIVMAQLLV
ncbi:MAG TPA: TrkA C-terminal domain-containing protein [Terriglobales bacterium]|nr:TrkA C-terminal domain-containing protein [Terriglobales bacterium]